MTQRRKRRRGLALLIGMGLIFIMIAGVIMFRAGAANEEPPTESAFFTDKIVVIGAPGRNQVTGTDARVIDTFATTAQVGALMPVPGAGSCALTSWASLGAEQEVVINSCEVSVGQRKVENFNALNAEAGGVLGALAQDSAGCITAVGQGAALAAADRIGELEAYADPANWLANRMPTTCAVTLVDVGADSDRVIGEMTTRPDVTVVVFGLPGSVQTAGEPQEIYRIGTTLPGVMFGAQLGQVTLPELGAALSGRPLLVSERDQVSATQAREVLRDARGGVPPLVWTLPLLIIVGLGIIIGLRARTTNRRSG